MKFCANISKLSHVLILALKSLASCPKGCEFFQVSNTTSQLIFCAKKHVTIDNCAVWIVSLRVIKSECKWIVETNWNFGISCLQGTKTLPGYFMYIACLWLHIWLCLSWNVFQRGPQHREDGVYAVMQEPFQPMSCLLTRLKGLFFILKMASINIPFLKWLMDWIRNHDEGSTFYRRPYFM